MNFSVTWTVHFVSFATVFKVFFSLIFFFVFLFPLCYHGDLVYGSLTFLNACCSCGRKKCSVVICCNSEWYSLFSS